MERRSRLERLLSIPALSSPVVSPDGRWVAWSWSRLGPAADPFVAPTDRSRAPIRLAQTGENTYVRSWSRDGRSVVVAHDHGGDERVSLFRIDLDDPGRLHPLTPSSPPYFLQGGELHPNGRWLFYGANYDFEREEEIEPTWVYRHDLVEGERRVLARPSRGAPTCPSLNRSGTHVLYPRSDLDPWGVQYWLVDVEGNDDREILNFGAANPISAAWLPDGERVLFLADTKTHRKLGVWHLSDGSIEWWIDDPARNLEAAFAPENGGGIVVVEIRETRVHASLLDPDGGEERALPELPGNLTPLAPIPGKEEEWIGIYSHSTHPRDIVAFPLSEPGRFTSVTGLWAQTEVTRAELPAAEDFRWRSEDGLEIQGWLYRAAEPARGTIVYVHGGPTAHTSDAFDPEVAFYVGEGFHVLAPNYRGSTGFGIPFQEAIKVDGWGGREQRDIRTGAEALLAAGIARAGKIGITGTSYGGYSAWFAAVHASPHPFAAAAPICGMTDLVVDYETTRPDLRPYSEAMMGGSPAQCPEKYRRASPIHFIDQIRCALLIVQGLEDPNVTPENVAVVRKALDAAGIPYETLLFEDEGHGIRKRENLERLYLRMADFFHRAFEEGVER